MNQKSNCGMLQSGSVDIFTAAADPCSTSSTALQQLTRQVAPRTIGCIASHGNMCCSPAALSHLSMCTPVLYIEAQLCRAKRRRDHKTYHISHHISYHIAFAIKTSDVA